MESHFMVSAVIAFEGWHMCQGVTINDQGPLISQGLIMYASKSAYPSRSVAHTSVPANTSRSANTSSSTTYQGEQIHQALLHIKVS
jgi:hypothetical protein